MTNMGATPPSPGMTDETEPVEEPTVVTGPPYPEKEDALPAYAEKEVPQHPDRQTNLRRAREIGDRLMEKRFRAELAHVGHNDSEAQDAIAKKLGTLILALLAVPGDTDLHEKVFRMAQEMTQGAYAR